MPRRASFAEVSRAVTKNRAGSGGTAPEPLRKRFASSAKLLKKSKFAEAVEKNLSRNSKKDSKKAGEQEQNADAASKETPTGPEAEVPAGKEEDGLNESAVEGNDDGGKDNNDAELVVLGGDVDDDAAAAGEDEEEEKEDDDAEEEKKAEAEAEAGEASRKLRWKKMTKKQRLLEEERLEEEKARNERRARRAERKRKKEEQEELAKVEAPQSLDEVAFKESVYELVKTALNLSMNQEDVNITVDNLPQLMKSFELDTGDEDIKDAIIEALLDTYGIIEPSKIDGLIMKKQIEKDLDELEECVDTAFAVIDQDRDGLITQNDVYRVMIHLGEVLWDTQVAAILNAADVDGDGKISKKDLFLFLLGHEKTVRVEDQILSKFGGGNALGEDSKEAETATTADDASATTTTPQDSSAAATGAAEPSPAPATTTSLAATLKATELPEDVAAAARRRKMMSGYSKMAMAVKAIANSGPGSVSKDTAVTATTAEEPAAADAAEKVSKTEESPAPPPEVTTTDVSDEAKKDDSTLLPAPPTVSASDWSDSGHAGSERDDDTCPNDSVDDNDDDDESQFDCGPLALDASIAYLPAPEFCSPRTPRSRRSSCSRQSTSPRPKSRDNVQCGSPANTNVDHDPTTEAISSARTEQTSEYDSEEREGTLKDDDEQYQDEDDDVLPETFQQNRILREIEKQVLHTKEALAQTKGADVPLKDHYVARVTTTTANNNNCDPADGCESVVESVIHPVYVPPCAREVSRSRRFGSSILDQEDRPGPRPRSSLGNLTVEERSKFRSDKNRLEPPVVYDDYATSTSEILSKGYVSLSTPRSLSTLATTHKPKLIDAYDDDGLLPGEDAVAVASTAYGGGFRDILVPANFADYKMHAAMKDCQCEGAKKLTVDEEIQVADFDLDADLDAFEDEAEEEANTAIHADILVDGVPSTMRPTCERARKLSARKEHPPPLRRSLTCHLVTVKDLTLNLNNSPSGSPARREFHRQSSVVAKHSFSPQSKDSHARREPSGSPAFRRRQFFSTSGAGTGGAAQSNRADSPLSHVGRMYSPSNRMDSFRTASNMDSARSSKELSTFRSPGRNLESTHWASARSHRDPPRSNKDTWRTLRSHLSRRDSFREKLTARSGDRTNRSQRTEREDGEDAEPEEEFRFCGPNFDAIMSKKGEPEELLQESLYRDAVARSGEAPPGEIFEDFRPPTNRGGRVGGGVGVEESAPAPGENRKVLISRQLERVKQMETLIMQRRGKMGNDSDDDDAGVESSREVSPRGHHLGTGLRRSKSTLHIRAAPDDRAHDAELSSEDVARWVADGAGSYKARPKSCMAGRRRGGSASNHRVVTISDAAAGGETSVPSTIRCNSNNASPARASPGRLDSPGRMYIGSPGRASNAGSPGRSYLGSPGRTSNTGSPARAYIGSPDRMSNTGSPGRPFIGSPGRASNATGSPGRTYGGHPDAAQEDVHEEPKVHVVDLTSLLDKVNEPDVSEEDSLHAPNGDGGNNGNIGAVAGLGVGGVGESEQRRNNPKFKPLARVLVPYERARRRQANVAAVNSAETSISRKLEQGIPYRAPSPPRQPHDDRSPAGLSRWHRRRKDNSPHYFDSTTTNATTTITAGENHFSEIDTVHAAQRQGLSGGTLHHQGSSASFVLSADQEQESDHHPLIKSFLEAVEKHEDDGSPFSGAHGHGVRSAAAAANSSVNFEFPERSVCVLKPNPALAVRTENM